jgi:hypothetical protein
VAQLDAAEQTSAADRAKAVALIAAATVWLGANRGLTAIIHSLAGGVLGFRGVFVLAVVPLAFLPLIGRWVDEPDRFVREVEATKHPRPVLGAVGPGYRRRLLIVAALAFGLSVIPGPANSFLFVYA